MTRLSLISILGAGFVSACTQAAAEVPHDVSMFGMNQPRMELHPGEGRCFAVITVIDLLGMYDETETFETDFGLVSVEYDTIGLHGTSPDMAYVRALPDGVWADPMEMELVQDVALPICLFRYLGG